MTLITSNLMQSSHTQNALSKFSDSDCSLLIICYDNMSIHLYLNKHSNILHV